MALEIIRNDIAAVSADAIVNSANPFVKVGRGVDQAIYRAAGFDLLKEAREKIGPIEPGDAEATPAFGLDADYIIHTVGPKWMGGDSGEAETVRMCYLNSLALAKELGCSSIAFPLISTGTYRFPKDLALRTAVSAISEFLFENEMDVTMVVHDDESFEISSKVFNDIRECLDMSEDNECPDMSEEYEADKISVQEEPVELSGMPDLQEDDVPVTGPGRKKLSYGAPDNLMGMLYNAPAAGYAPDEKAAAVPLEDLLKNREETFQQRLFRLIDRKGLEDTEVYKKANLDRKLFSKIRSNVNYNPSKRTAVALAVSLGLNLDETKDLLLRAGIALSRSDDFDIIIEYCLTNGITDIFEINNVLFKFKQPILGG